MNSCSAFSCAAKSRSDVRLLREEEATQKQTRAGWSTSEAQPPLQLIRLGALSGLCQARDIQSLYNAHAGEEGRLDEAATVSR